MKTEVPNLDDMTMDPAELRAWADSVKPDQFGYATFQIVRYASYKAEAMEARLRGDIPLAKDLEETCDRIYKFQIPKSLRW